MVNNKSLLQFRIVVIASIGALFENYDFMVCVFLAPYLIKIFFSSHITLGIFAIFTIAFFSRPVGGVVWGHLGDRYGRKKVFSLTMLLLAIPTLLIAIFPTNISPIFNISGFILLRFMQGFLVGGEFPGGITFISEVASARNRGLLVAIFMATLTAGTLFASFIILLLTSFFTDSEIIHWAWRLPFILSLALVGIAIYIRTHIKETILFVRLKQLESIEAIPIISLFKTNKKQIIQGFILTCSAAIILITLYSFLPQIIGISGVFKQQQILTLTSTGLLIVCLVMPFAGYLGDLFGHKFIFIISLMLLVFANMFIYMALQSASYNLMFIGIVIISIIFAMINANYCVLLSEIFPTKIRFTGIAFCYTLGYSICGGLLPLIYITFSEYTKNFSLPGLLIFISSITAFLVSFSIKDLHKKALM